jgi:peptidoglycan hydrolase-like protein with peptidoglycan-binding domain
VKGAAVIVVAALCGVVVTIAVRGTPAPAAPNPPRVGTARIVVTDLSSAVLTQGTLGYAPSLPVVNRAGGTYTSLLSAGNVVGPGQVLYRVDNEPVVLMAGAVPAWRPFALGMADGPDVQELESNLIALGDARDLLDEPSVHFGPATAAAVGRWQTALGLPATGSIDLGAVIFAPSSLRLDAVNVSPGQSAAPGDQPYQVTTTVRTVSVPLTPDDPPVGAGQAVAITLPSGQSVPGRVASVGPPTPNTQSGSSSSGSGSSGSGSSGSSVASTVLTVVPDDPSVTGTGDGESVQVSLTIESVHHVLAVPISALLALAGGGYGLEVIGSSGHHTLVGVRTGVFAGGAVQVSGPGLAAGGRVVIAQ